MPNAANIYALIRDIEAEEIREFNMNRIDCGAAACIIGFVGNKLHGPEWKDTLGYSHARYLQMVMDHLDIDHNIADSLCWAPYLSGQQMADLTPRQARRALEDLAACSFTSWGPYLK